MTTTDVQSGRQKGRAVPAVPTHTFRDSGIMVKLHKLSPMTSQEIINAVRREEDVTKPKPPMFEVDYGKGKIEEPNEAHEVYQRRLKKWEDEVQSIANDRLFRTACLIAVEIAIDDEWRAYVKRMRRQLKATAKIDFVDDPELEPDENDQIFYITHIACKSPDDVREFYAAIALRSQPTEAAIEQHKQSFRSDIQGEVSVE